MARERTIADGALGFVSDCFVLSAYCADISKPPMSPLQNIAAQCRPVVTEALHRTGARHPENAKKVLVQAVKNIPTSVKECHHFFLKNPLAQRRAIRRAAVAQMST